MWRVGLEVCCSVVCKCGQLPVNETGTESYIKQHEKGAKVWRWGWLQLNETSTENGTQSHEQLIKMGAQIDAKSSQRRGGVRRAFR